MTAKNFEDFFASGGTTADLLYDLGRGYCVVARATLDAEWRAYKGDSPPAATAALEAAPPAATAGLEAAPPAAAAAPEEAPPAATAGLEAAPPVPERALSDVVSL